MLRSNISFLSKDEAKNSRGAAEYFLLQVLGPGFVIVVAVVVAVTAQLHPVKVLVGWEEEQGSRHTGGGGMADKGAEGTGGRQAGVTHAVRGKRRKKKKNSAKFCPVTTIRKIHLDLLKTKPKRKTKKPKM